MDLTFLFRRTSRFDVKYVTHILTVNMHILHLRIFLCVLSVSQDKEKLFPYTTLTEWYM